MEVDLVPRVENPCCVILINSSKFFMTTGPGSNLVNMEDNSPRPLTIRRFRDPVFGT